MGYLNNNTGYPDQLLQTRSIVKKENYVVLPQDGLVNNSVPGFENCQVSILGSPEMGASFADYLVTALEGGKNDKIGGDGIESFLFVKEGEIKVKADGKEEVLKEGGYIYTPSTTSLAFENLAEKSVLYLYKRRYNKIENYDIVVIIRKEAAGLDFENFYNSLKHVLKKRKLLKKEGKNEKIHI